MFPHRKENVQVQVNHNKEKWEDGMDILLNQDGDLYISNQGDLLLENSISQKIKIKLKWFEGEWRWKKEEGLPYFENLLVKNPDIDALEAWIREKIFEVEEVVDVKQVAVIFDNRTRQARIQFTALTDQEKIQEEVRILCQVME